MFEFDNKFYKEIQGTAMGTKLAPAHASIFMGRLEHRILYHASLKPTFYISTLLTTYSCYGHTLS